MSSAFDTARDHFLQGVQRFESGDFAGAEQALLASLALLPDRASTLSNLGATRLKLGRAEEARQALEASLALQPGDAATWCHLGETLLQLGQDAQALQALDNAIERRLGQSNAAIDLHRALALNRLERHAPALDLLQGLLLHRPHVAGDADVFLLEGQTLQCLGRHDEALRSYEHALALAPTLAQAWSLKGQRLQELGQSDAARHCFEQALALGADPDLHRYFLAALDAQRAPGMPGTQDKQGKQGKQGGAVTPAQSPQAYVRQLFDGYATTFDEHLLNVLQYRTHQVLAEVLQNHAPGWSAGGAATALDLGCGTGLAAPMLRPLAARLLGLDLSQQMLERARSTGLYDELICADAAEHLRHSTEPLDLVFSADVFVYIGDLGPLFAAAQARLRPGGVLAFSVEECAHPATAGQGYVLRSSLRYAHSEQGLAELAARHRLQTLALHRGTLRLDQQVGEIQGLYVLLQA